MVTYTTVTIPFVIQADLTDATIKVTFAQNNIKITKDVTSIEASDGVTSFAVTLSQTETGQFASNYPVYIQVNWMKNNIRSATGIKSVVFDPNLKGEWANG